jgi:hypothetical protein
MTASEIILATLTFCFVVIYALIWREERKEAKIQETVAFMDFYDQVFQDFFGGDIRAKREEVMDYYTDKRIEEAKETGNYNEFFINEAFREYMEQYVRFCNFMMVAKRTFDKQLYDHLLVVLGDEIEETTSLFRKVYDAMRSPQRLLWSLPVETLYDLYEEAVEASRSDKYKRKYTTDYLRKRFSRQIR